jgi:Ca2+-binding EF-hand superfamily protein
MCYAGSNIQPITIMKNATFKSLAASMCLLAAPFALAGDKGDKFQKMDTDGDGRVSRTEHAAGARQMFQVCDADGDGVMTAAELKSHGKKGHKSDKSKRHSSDGMSQQDEKRRHADDHGERHDKGDMSASEKIQHIDTDGDGRVTAAEHNAGTEQMFAKMDANSDGFLTEDEMKAGHKTMKRKDR